MYGESIYLFRLQFFLRPPKKRCAAKNLVLAAAVFFFCGIGLWQFACLSSPWLSACNHPWDKVAQCCGYGTYMCIGVIYNEIPSEIRWFFAPNGQSRVWRRCFGAKSQILFEMVQKGPDRPKGSKWPKTLRLTILVPFEPLWSVDKPAMFGHFWSKMDHFWAITSHERWTVDCGMSMLTDFEACDTSRVADCKSLLFLENQI